MIVHVKRDGNRRTLGRAYNGIPSIASTEGLQRWRWQYLIVVTDASFIRTLAHEARHVQRYRDGTDERQRRETGRRTGMEADCDSFGAWFDRIWQEHKTTLSGDAVVRSIADNECMESSTNTGGTTV